MPELPEVETVMRGLTPFLTGAIIEKAEKKRADLRIPFPKDIERKLRGKKILSLSRRAKYILIYLSDDLILSIHLGMSGSLTILEKGERYIAQPHDHFILKLKSGVRVIYIDPRRFGMIFTLKSTALDTHKFFHHLGPEPLSNNFSALVLKAALKNKKTSIKQALLDQRVVVGVGNIYACEALYLSGIRPTKRADRVTGKELETLVSSIRTVLKKAILAGGSSLRDYKKTDGSLGYFQHSFSVYDQEHQACPNCDCDIPKTGGIKRIIQSGRSTYYCPRKQR